MQQSLLKLLFTATMLLISAGMSAATLTLDGFTYSTNTTKLTASLTAGPKTGDVVIPDTISDGTKKYAVTAVAKNAFKNTAITSVKFPKTIADLGSNCFEGCASLTKVEFAEGLTGIGSYSFKNCSVLPEINLPSTLESISSYAFDGCKSLTSVVIPDNVRMFMSSPFQNCSSLRSITLGAKQTSFSATACKNCPLEEVLVSPDNTKLKSIDGVLYDFKATKLNYYPEYKKTETFTLPETVTNVAATFSGIQYLKTFICNDKLTSIANNMFQKCPELTTVKLGKQVKTFGNRCFVQSPKFSELQIDAENQYLKFVDGVVIAKDNTVLYTRLSVAPGTVYEAPDGLTTINAYAFSQNDKLTEIKLPESVESIGTYAFTQCTALKSINIPAGIKTIESATFYRCNSLEAIELPASIGTIDESAFYGCSLTGIVLPQKLVNIGASAFEANSLTSLVVPDSVTTIGENAFFDNESLSDITIGSSVTSIGNSAFRTYMPANITVIMKPAVPPTLASTDDYYIPFEKGSTTMFVSRASLDTYKANEAYAGFKIEVMAEATEQSVTLEQAGTLSAKVPADLLNGISGLTVKGEINGADFEFINRMPMLAKLNLAETTIVAGGSEIITAPNVFPSKAVASLNKLENIQLPAGIVELADSSLCAPDEYSASDRLSGIIIPSTVTRIGAYALCNRSGLTEIKLPDGLKYLGEHAFASCSALKAIEIPAGVDTIRASAFVSCSDVTDLKIHDGVKVIEENAFMYCAKLEQLVIPNSIDSIGGFAFASNRLKDITLSNSLRHLGNYAFAWSRELEEIVLPESLTYIGASCFSGCGKLTKVNIPDNVTVVSQSAFVLDSALVKISIPLNITRLGANICERCKSLKIAIVAYPYSIPGEYEPATAAPEWSSYKISAGSSAFANCTSLETLYIGPSLKLLGENFAGNTPSLKKIFVANSTPPQMYDGESAFTSYDATLYVPKKSMYLYMLDKNWGKFLNIKAIEDEMTALDEIFDNPAPGAITVENGTMSFGDPSANVSVFSIAGQLIYSGPAIDLNVEPGLYIVNINSRSCKILVQ